MMMLPLTAADMRRLVGGRVTAIPGMTAAGVTTITRMAAACYSGAVAASHSAGGSGHRCGSVPSLRVEACPANCIHRRRTGTAAIGRCKLITVEARRMIVIELFAGRLNMILPHRDLLIRIGPGVDPDAAVEAGAIHYRIVDDGPVDISVVNNRGIYIHDGRIVPEVTAVPFTPNKTHSPITITIIDAAIKADMRSPISAMPAIDTAGVTPITRRP